jgi:hypothetical protein
MSREAIRLRICWLHSCPGLRLAGPGALPIGLHMRCTHSPHAESRRDAACSCAALASIMHTVHLTHPRAEPLPRAEMLPRAKMLPRAEMLPRALVLCKHSCARHARSVCYRCCCLLSIDEFGQEVRRILWIRDMQYCELAVCYALMQTCRANEEESR